MDSLLISAEALDQLRRDRGFSVRKLAEAVETEMIRVGGHDPSFSRSSMGHLCTGYRRVCRADRAAAIERVLGVGSGSLFRLRIEPDEWFRENGEARMTTTTKPDGRFGLPGKLMEAVLVPGSPEWVAAGISSSRIAAIVGKSYWSSAFETWHIMAGNLPYDGSVESDIQRRGRLLEPAIAQWFAEEHRDFKVYKSGTWQHRDNPKFISSPDYLAVAEAGTALVECKSALVDDEWGDPGTGDVPEPYRIQIQWHIGVCGAERCYLPVLKSHLEFEEYIVARDDRLIESLMTQAQEFMDTLPGGPHEALPALDGHDATYQAIRRMNPMIEDGSVEIPFELAADLASVKAQKKELEEREKRLNSAIADKLGPFKNAVLADGTKVAYRKSARKGSVPHVAVAPGLKKLPNLSLEEAS